MGCLRELHSPNNSNELDNFHLQEVPHWLQNKFQSTDYPIEVVQVLDHHNQAGWYFD